MRSLTVLVVDDEQGIRRALEKALTRQGHQVLLATSGEAACDVLATATPDVVLMDLRMPSMSGQTLFHTIAARWPDLVQRVVVMTGDAHAEDHFEWLELYRPPILMKPFELAQLYALLKTVSERRRRSQG